jgi:hypothetical protein
VQVDKRVIDELVNELEDPNVALNDFSRVDFRKKEKGFHCKLCRKSFDRLNTLKRHLVTHMGAREGEGETGCSRFGEMEN